VNRGIHVAVIARSVFCDEAIHLKSWIAASHKERGTRNDTQNVSAGIQSLLKILSVFSLLMLLTACGQSGKLYLSPTPASSAAAKSYTDTHALYPPHA